MQDPEVMAVLQKPGVMEAMTSMMSGGKPDLSNPNVQAAMELLQRKMPGMMGGMGGGVSEPATSSGTEPTFEAGDDVD
jgi:hypothetical protein